MLIAPVIMYIRRIVDVTQALRTVYVLESLSTKEWYCKAYKSPVAKIAKIPNFFRGARCSFQMDTMGRSKITKSEKTLNIAPAIPEASVLAQ